MFDVLAKFEKDTKEYEDMIYRITCMQGYSQEVIDSCKGIVPKKVPKEWYSYKKVKIKESDTNEEKEVKQYNLNLLANKKPYFFIYNYKYLKNEYNNYIKNTNINCLIKFGMNFEQLSKKEEKTNEEIQFINLFNILNPISNNKSVVNRICYKIEEELINISLKIRKSSFDKNILMTDKKIKNKIKEEILNLYNEYKEDIQSIIKSKNNNANIDENKNSRHLYMIKFKEKAEEICKNDIEMLCNILVDLLYDNNNSKQFVWDLCGDYIVDKLLSDNNYNINIPIKNKDGEIIWNGLNYSLENYKLKENNHIC